MSSIVEVESLECYREKECLSARELPCTLPAPVLILPCVIESAAPANA